MAAQAGTRRRIEALRLGRKPVYGDTKIHAEWGVDIEGAAAEMAVAKAYNLFWTPVVQRPEELPGDVGRGMHALQVRSTPREHGRLILHERDKDDAIFVLVTGRIPAFTIRGWIQGKDGKCDRFLHPGDGRPAFFVPQEHLRQGHPPVVPWARDEAG